MTTAPGTIALAAYRPDPVLFTRQLTSIQAQTVTDFTCIISADGAADEVAAIVERAVRGDERFTVIGFDHRVGFYRNFERALEAVDASSEWVALSDQDDFWHAGKLERLVPLLENHAIASGQARVVAYPSDVELLAHTDRHDTDRLDLTAINQFSGAMSVFRREVLDIALPFPRVASPVAVHDHWLAVCAAVQGETIVVEEVLQDYVQHDGNVLGEPGSAHGVHPVSAWRTLTTAARRQEDSISPLALARALYAMGFGWRTAMVSALQDRLGADHRDLAELGRVFGADSSLLHSLGYLASPRRHGASNAIMLTAGRLLDGGMRRRFLRVT